MAATAIDERIAKTEKRLTQLREQRRRKEAAERAASAKRERAADTRRKILAGAVILADPGLRGLVMEALRQRLTRQDDRALFRLFRSAAGRRRCRQRRDRPVAQPARRTARQRRRSLQSARCFFCADALRSNLKKINQAGFTARQHATIRQDFHGIAYRSFFQK